MEKVQCRPAIDIVFGRFLWRAGDRAYQAYGMCKRIRGMFIAAISSQSGNRWSAHTVVQK